MARRWLPLILIGVAFTAACITFNAPSLPPLSPEARGELRAQFPGLVLSCALVAIGVAALVLAKFHWSAQGVELLSFGAFALLYGVRLAGWLPASRWIVDLSPDAWRYVDAIITYVIPVPVLFFLEPFLGRVKIVRWLWRVQLAYAVVASAVDIALGEPFAAIGPYRVLVITWFVVALYFMFRRREGATTRFKVVRAGLLIFLLLAGHATISGAFSLPGAVSAEPLGLFVFFVCLGYAVVDGFFSSQQQLGAIHHELETAKKIQSSVLPETLPEIDGFDLAVRYLPVSAVAGDFYDFLENERGLSLLVADVSGHGVPAALIASMVKIAYSAQSERSDRPSQVLSEVNRILCGKIRGQFVTGGCLFLAGDEPKVVYSTAGHPPLVVVRASGAVFERRLESVLMGFVTDVQYPREEISLVPGDKLVLYTDGLTEAMNRDGEFFGVERLLAFFEAHASESAEELAQGMVEHVRAWSDRPFDDDVTLLVVGKR